MARRRKKKNPLLIRIVIGVIVAHMIALPILAHFGAFDRIKQGMGESRVVMITTPPLEEKKTPKAPPKKEHKATPTAHHGPSTPAHSAASHSNLAQPKVVAAAGAGGEGGGPTVDANATGKAGVLPTAPAAPAPKPQPQPEPQPQPQPKPEPKPEPTPAPTPKPEPKPEPTPAPKAHRFAQVETTYAPEPTIPDDLRAEPFEKTLVVEASIDTDGKPSDVKVAESTGTKELDDIGLATAKQYRFKPATLDDVPVEGKVRFRIVFKVE